MATQEVTKPIALDETLQATNTALSGLNTTAGGIAKDTTLQTQNGKLDTLNTKLQAIADAIADSSVIGDTDISEIADGTLTGAVAQFDEDISGLDTDKADKVTGATNDNLAALDENGNLKDGGWSSLKTTTSATGNPISISGLKSNQLAVNPIITLEPIQAGSGTPSPSNIRAISGYDKIEVLSVGKNLLPSSTIQSGTTNGLTHTVYKNQNGEVEKIVVSGKATAVSEIVIQLPLQLKNGEYILSGCPSGGGNNSFALDYLNASYSQSRDTGSGVTFTVNDNAYYVRIRWFDTTNTYSNIEFKPMIRLSSITDATYEPYHKTTDISESLGQTVYGGTLDARTGKASITWLYKDLGDLSWSYDITYQRFLAEAPNIKQKGARELSFVCSCYECISDRRELSDVPNYAIYSSGAYLYIHDSRYTNATAFKTAVTGQKIAYPIATPTEIQLTPHEISLLKDYAYISTNGTSIALDYHNGELASLADVAQVGETVNLIGNGMLKHQRIKHVFGNVTANNFYDYNMTTEYENLTWSNVVSITMTTPTGNIFDHKGVLIYRPGSNNVNIVIEYQCGSTATNVYIYIDILYV